MESAVDIEMKSSPKKERRDRLARSALKRVDSVPAEDAKTAAIKQSASVLDFRTQTAILSRPTSSFQKAMMTLGSRSVKKME